MASEGETNGNLQAHTDSYTRFIWWLKTGTIASAIVAALAILAITR